MAKSATKPDKTATKDVETSAKPTEDIGNDIPKSSLTSGVTTDLPGTAPEDKGAQDDAYNDLDAITKSGLGLITVDGNGFQFIGSRSKDAETPGGLKVTSENSTFKPLATVPFSNSIRVQDPKSGEFYFPPDDCTGWPDCNLDGSYLIERKKAKK